MARRCIAAAQFLAGIVIGVIGAAMALYAAMQALLGGATREQEQWYETSAVVWWVPAVFLLLGAGWLLRDGRARFRD